MLVRSLVIAAAIGSALSTPVAAAGADPNPVAARSSEMPELSRPGDLAVGTAFREVRVGPRTIGLRLWYPGTAGQPGTSVTYRHSLSLPGQPAVDIVQPGIAVDGRAALPDRRFPLVVLSHGYGGWADHFSGLGETLASRGYVVASIDHRDLAFTDAASFATSFGTTLLTRAAEQKWVLKSLLDGSLGVSGIDTAAVGLIGYSMGGYGALVTAGVPTDPGSPALAQMPPALRALVPGPDPDIAARIKAVVAIAPWGAQPGAAVWTDAALATLATPLLLISGDQDDVVDYDKGVRRIFDAATRSDRRLLVYREAAHNVAGNPVKLAPDAPFAVREAVSDPVWRKERIEAINAHFIVAFLDSRLKGDAAKDGYLAVPTPISNDGDWPSAFGQQWNGRVAGDDQPRYWRGFQRRWATGLEMHYRKAGE
jgi:alpha-beta hydrolase superfamily lysophospholipase